MRLSEITDLDRKAAIAREILEDILEWFGIEESRENYIYAQNKGYSFLQVKTLQMGRDEGYDKTKRFYQSVGFKEFEVFPNLWDVHNPCQIYVVALWN